MITRATVSMLAIMLVGRALVSTAQQASDPGAAAVKNPVAATRESLAAGRKAYDLNCAPCHGNMAQGAEKAGVLISIIQEQGGKQPHGVTERSAHRS